jgi:hypothetical protein
MAELERQTTVAVYTADLERLKTTQRKISADRNTWVPMPDLIRDLVNEAAIREQDGIVMVPLIENPEAFAQRTAELRAQGFDKEADSRDRFAKRETT